MRSEARRRPAPGESAPAFRHGGFDLAAHLGQRPVVLLFLPDMNGPACADYVAEFAADITHYQSLNAVVAVVTPSCEARELAEVTLVPGAEEAFAFYGLGRTDWGLSAGLVIIDRYGQVSAVYERERCSDLPDEQIVARVLLGAESVCPECGVPEDHWVKATR